MCVWRGVGDGERGEMLRLAAQATALLMADAASLKAFQGDRK